MAFMEPLDNVTDAHGGKALGLRALIERGLQVPRGLALDEEAIRHLLTGDELLLNQLRDWLAQGRAKLAVRSSALNEDGVTQSFAGVYETVLSVNRSMQDVLQAIEAVSVSGGSARARAYSGQEQCTIPVILQDLVDAECSGVLFTHALDPSGKDCAYIEWVLGLGDALVSGRATPATITFPWSEDKLLAGQVQISRAIPDASLAEALVPLIENLANAYGNVDVEWAFDKNSSLWALQMRPVTREVLVASQARAGGGLPAAPGVASGPAHSVGDDNHAAITEGEVLVARITEADYIPAMFRSAAIITEEGGLLSHAAIVAREFGKPCVVGLAGARNLIRDGEFVEVNGSTGAVTFSGHTIGGQYETDIDWTSVYHYDRGLELSINDISVYVEPTLDGLIACMDDGASASDVQAIDSYIRRKYHVSPRLVESDRRLWHREWRRFDRLQCVALTAAPIEAAIAAWDPAALKASIANFKRIALAARAPRGASPMEKVFCGEVGAALHALVALQVEGRALWRAYQDSANWRTNTGVSFSQFLLGDHPQARTRVARPPATIIRCIAILSKFRNTAYPFFSKNRIFDGEYFGQRMEMLLNAPHASGKAQRARDEDELLNSAYASSEFKAMDRSFSKAVIEIIGRHISA